MNEIQLTNHLTAQIHGINHKPVRGRNPRGRRLQSLHIRHEPQRLKRKCEKYAKRERKAIEYVATLKEES